MFDYQDPSKIALIRKQIFRDQGFYLIKNFLDIDLLKKLKSFWIENNSIDYYFSDPVSNRDVNISTFPYLLKGISGDTHKSYCLSIFNTPIDVLTHEVAFHASILRKSVADLPICTGKLC